MEAMSLDHLSRYVKAVDVSEATFQKYQGRVPEYLLGIWRSYGFGTCMGGYLKLVNPDHYAQIYQDGVAFAQKEVVFAATGLADLVAWVGDAVRLVDFRHARSSIVNSANLERFFQRRLADSSYLSEEFRHEHYEAARQALGEPAFDECFGYEPILAAGGEEQPSKLKKVKTLEHIHAITQFIGPIE